MTETDSEELLPYDNGNTLLVTAPSEDSALASSPNDNDLEDAGAAYVFTRRENTWVQHSFIKSPEPDINDEFGTSATISGNGKTIAIGAIREDSNATGVDGDATNNDVSAAGAVYLFKLVENKWDFQSYFKAASTTNTDRFGFSVALNKDGTLLAASAAYEDSGSVGIDGDPHIDQLAHPGAAYVFSFEQENWKFSHYVKAINPGEFDLYGTSLDLSENGQILIIGAPGEKSNGQGFSADPNNNYLEDAGAVYIY